MDILNMVSISYIIQIEVASRDPVVAEAASALMKTLLTVDLALIEA